MRKFILILFFILFSIGAYAKEAKWYDLKGVVHHSISYSSSDYHLREDVAALEIRTYGFSNNYKKSKIIPIGIYVTPLKLIEPKLLKKFRNAFPNLDRKGDIRNPPDFRGDKNRAFVIKTNGDVSRMNEISDIIHYLGEIDRPAEAYLVWWMHSKYSGVKDTEKWKSAYRPLVQSRKYCKTLQGYEMIIKYTISRSYGEKNKLCHDSQGFTDKAIVDKKGHIVYFKQLHKSKIKTECSEVNCGVPPMPIMNTRKK